MYVKIVHLARGVAACLAATLCVGVAGAHDQHIVYRQGGTDAPLQYVVRFPDLNLSTIAGVGQLYGRLRTASELVCPLETDEPLRRLEQHVCETKAVGDAVASINSPLLSQYHQLRTRGDRAGMALLAKSQ